MSLGDTWPSPWRLSQVLLKSVSELFVVLLPSASNSNDFDFIQNNYILNFLIKKILERIFFLIKKFKIK